MFRDARQLFCGQIKTASQRLTNFYPRAGMTLTTTTGMKSSRGDSPNRFYADDFCFCARVADVRASCGTVGIFLGGQIYVSAQYRNDIRAGFRILGYSQDTQTSAASRNARCRERVTNLRSQGKEASCSLIASRRGRRRATAKIVKVNDFKNKPLSNFRFYVIITTEGCIYEKQIY